MEYKKYELNLITLAPVHIGSGEVRSSKEFIYEKGAYYFPEMGKVYLALNRKNPLLAKAFEDYLYYTPQNKRKGKRLVEFFREKQIRDRDFGGFKIQETGEEVYGNNKGNGRLNEVHLFMRDAQQRPYIPGSSLKGALRSIFESEYFKSSRIPWGAKKGEPFNDIFNNIRVEDSVPIPEKSLAIVRKIDYSLGKNIANGLPIYREALRPRMSIKFHITAVDSGIKLMDELIKLSQKRYERYTDFYLKDCPPKYVQNNFPGYGSLYLGAGSGLWTKFNLSDQKSVRKIIEKKQNIRNPKMKMKGKGAFKLTRYPAKSVKLGKKSVPLIKNQENYYEMGKCNFSIKVIE